MFQTRLFSGKGDNMKVTIIAGISGSGKSTLAGAECGGSVRCSADDFFTDKVGDYHFNPAKLGEAHAMCLRKFVEALLAGKDAVVDNTNTTSTELAPYIALANAYGVDLRIVVIRCDAEIAARRNTHGVPERAVRAMASRLERTLAHWPRHWPEPEIRDAVI